MKRASGNTSRISLIRHVWPGDLRTSGRLYFQVSFPANVNKADCHRSTSGWRHPERSGSGRRGRHVPGRQIPPPATGASSRERRLVLGRDFDAQGHVVHAEASAWQEDDPIGAIGFSSRKV